MQIPKGIFRPSLDEIIDQLPVAGQLVAALVVAGIAEVIAVKQTGITMLAKQNQGISEWLKPVINPGFQRLPRLAIVVVYKRDGQQRVFFHQRVVENLDRSKSWPFFEAAWNL